MHIAWLGKKSPFCGNVTYGREITNGLLDRGKQVSFLHFAEADSLSEDSHPNCPEVVLPYIYKSQIYTLPAFGSSKVLFRSIQDLKPHLVHASLTLSPLDFILPEICEELNIPLVATFHPPFDSKIRNLTSSTQYLTYQLYAPCLAKYDRVIVFSNIQKELLIKLGVPTEKVVIIPNGVDSQKYSPGYSTIKAQFNHKRLFVYQGRIAPEKNIETLLKAWKASKMGEDCLLLMVGDGPLAPALKSSYHQEDGILWLGFIGDEQERINILRSADVFILPSLVEGLSLSLLEAMSCGVACIATDAGADGEVLESAGIVIKTDGVTGQLKNILPIFRDHPEMSSMLGQKCRKRVLDRYTLSQNLTYLENLYAELVGKNALQMV